MKFYKSLLIAVALSLPIFLFSQQNKIDSLRQSLHLAQHDSNRVHMLNELSTKLSHISKQSLKKMAYDSAMRYAIEAKEISEKLLSESTDQTQKTALKQSLGNAYTNMAFIFTKQNNFRAALRDNASALQIWESINDMKEIAASYNHIGSIYYIQRDWNQALKNYQKALEIQKKLNDVDGVIDSDNDIGIFYRSLQKYDDALIYLKEALKVEKEQNNKELMDETYEELGNTYDDMGNLEEALASYKACLKISEETGDTENITDSINNIQNVNEKNSAQAQADSKKEKIILFFVLGLLLFALFFAAFIFRSLRVTQKQKNIIEHQKMEVEGKNKVIEEQKNIVEEKNKDITDSINYAQRIQRSMLPHRKAILAEFPQSLVLFKPKDIVSGDFYYYTKRGDCSWLGVCDCTGHGVPGAFMSLLNISFLNEAINEKQIAQPNEAVNYVRKRLIENISQNGGQDGMDGIFIKWRMNNGGWRIEYSCANNAPLLIRDGKVIELECDPMPVGASPREENSFTNHVCDLQKNDIIVTYTDGFADQFGGPKGKKFKYKQLNELLLAISDKPMAEQKNILDETFEKWKGNMEQVDDVLLIAIKV
ncbi:MAG TPA: tetratricopeptide repeat protein [Bacteroidia bacterium]